MRFKWLRSSKTKRGKQRKNNNTNFISFICKWINLPTKDKSARRPNSQITTTSRKTAPHERDQKNELTTKPLCLFGFCTKIETLPEAKLPEINYIVNGYENFYIMRFKFNSPTKSQDKKILFKKKIFWITNLKIFIYLCTLLLIAVYILIYLCASWLIQVNNNKTCLPKM